MFTGIIQQKGKILNRKKNGNTGSLVVSGLNFESPEIGESVAVNGCCLSLEKYSENGTCTFHTLAETLNCTNLGELRIGSEVNIERALRLSDRLGGHLVSGHIDAACAVISNRKIGGDTVLKIAATPELEPFIVPKGSIAVNGVSLTVADCGTDYFTIHLIPLTLEDSNLAELRSGMTVNIETDLIGKYLFYQNKKGKKATLASLLETGFF